MEIDYGSLGRRMTLKPQKLEMVGGEFYLTINKQRIRVNFTRKGFQGFSRIAQTSTHQALRKDAKSGRPLGFKVVGDTWYRYQRQGAKAWSSIEAIVKRVLAKHPKLVYHVDLNASPPQIVGITKTWCHDVDPVTLFGGIEFPKIDKFDLSDDVAYTLMTLARYQNGFASMYLRFGLSGIEDANFGVFIRLGVEDQKGKTYFVEKWIALVENKHLGKIVDFQNACHSWIARQGELQERMSSVDFGVIEDIINKFDKRAEQRPAIEAYLSEHFTFGEG